MTTEFNEITFNFQGEVRHETLDGREYLVAPLSMLVPGVLNGSKGPLLYTPEEIALNYDSWNGVPIVLNHPTRKGKGVSARSPKVLEKYGIGYVFNTTVDGGLKSEGWFDVEKTKKVDKRVLNALLSGNPIELSTGLFSKNLKRKGKFGTKPYIGVVTNIRPDHLAVLPDKKGACSFEDGCGVLVNEEGESKVENELSHDDIRTKLAYACRLKLGGTNPVNGEPSAYCWVAEVYMKSFVYEYQGKYYKAGYKVNAKSEEVEVDDGPHDQVVRKTVYELVSNEEMTTNCGGDCDCAPCKAAQSEKPRFKSVASKLKIKAIVG